MNKMQRARLIPTSGIGGTSEAEQRATSALLAVLSIVRELSDELLSPLGASRAVKATVEAFTEVEVKLSSGKVRPDGLIVVTYGKSIWKALVEVKTGSAQLNADQLNSYLEAAKEIEADIVISISNEIGLAGAHPTAGLNVRSNSRVKVHHYSWTEILSEAVRCKVHAGVADPEQAWILGELIRYLEHPASGVTAFDDMGPAWIDVRDGVRQGMITSKTEGTEDIATKWDELLRHIVLHLSSETGAEVQQVLSRSQQNPKDRLKALKSDLVESGILAGDIRVPDTASDMEVTADLRARQISVAASISAPAEKKGKGSITWLTRQLKSAPADIVIEAFEKNARTPIAASLTAAQDDPGCLLPNGKGDVHKFRIVLNSEAGASRKNGGRSPGFIESVNGAVETFYASVLQNITPWSPPTPKVKKADFSGSEPQPASHERTIDIRDTAAEAAPPASVPNSLATETTASDLGS